MVGITIRRLWSTNLSGALVDCSRMKEAITLYSQHFWCQSPLTHQTAQASQSLISHPLRWIQPKTASSMSQIILLKLARWRLSRIVGIPRKADLWLTMSTSQRNPVIDPHTYPSHLSENYTQNPDLSALTFGNLVEMLTSNFGSPLQYRHRHRIRRSRDLCANIK